MNQYAEMAEFAENLYDNYIKYRLKDETSDVMSFYRATVTANNNDGTLTIQRPFDSTGYTVRCTDGMSTAKADDKILVVRFGNGNNGANHLAVATSDGNFLVGANSIANQAPTWTAPRVRQSRCTISWGGYYRVGKLVYIDIELSSLVNRNPLTGYTYVEGLPAPVRTNEPLSARVVGVNDVYTGFVQSDGGMGITNGSTGIASGDTLRISGCYFTSAI